MSHPDRPSPHAGSADLRVGVIAGSTRPGRRALEVADWVCREHGVAGVELTVIDLAEVDLPILAEPTPAALGGYELDRTRQWSALVASFDAFVLVSPEYNHSTTAVLKNALDHLYAEWRDKAVAFVGYGVDGGVRAVEHLRGIIAELGLAGVGPGVLLGLFDDFPDQRCDPRPHHEQARQRMLSELARWARVMRPLRSTDTPATVPGRGDGRPRLHDSAHETTAVGAVRDFVAELQDGLDRGDPERYDRAMAADVLWGSPYGQVLTGADTLLSAHRTLMSTATAPPSRYEVVQTCAPAPGVVLAHVRRTALPNPRDSNLAEPTSEDAGEFCEMALYVLVADRGQWWLAAGQNTPVARRSAQP